MCVCYRRKQMSYSDCMTLFTPHVVKYLWFSAGGRVEPGTVVCPPMPR